MVAEKQGPSGPFVQSFTLHAHGEWRVRSRTPHQHYGRQYACFLALLSHDIYQFIPTQSLPILFGSFAFTPYNTCHCHIKIPSMLTIGISYGKVYSFASYSHINCQVLNCNFHNSQDKRLFIGR